MTSRRSNSSTFVYRLAALASALLVTATAACSSGGSTTATTNTAPGASSDAGVVNAKSTIDDLHKTVPSYPKVPALADVASLRGKTVWYVPIGGGVPILDTFGASITKSFGQAGINVQVCDGKFLPTTIASCFDQAGRSGAAAVIGGAIDYNLAATSINSLADKKINVLLSSESPPAGVPDNPYVHYYDTTDATSRYTSLAMLAAIADSSGIANILYVGYTDTPLGSTATAEAEKTLQANCSGCSYTKIEYKSSQIDKLSSQISAALIKNSNVDYIVVESDGAVAPAIAAIKSSGKNGKVKISGATGDLSSLQLIGQKAAQFSDAGINAPYFGWSIADGTLRAMLNQPITVLPQIFRVFDGTNVGDLTLTADAYGDGSWFGVASAYETTFLSAWGLS